MKYVDARPLIKSGDIIALTHRRWSSWYDLQIQIVRIFTQSEYCHVGLVWELQDRLFVIEAVTPYVRIAELSAFARAGFYHIAVGTPINEKELAYAMDQVGKMRYSKWQAILGFLRLLKGGKDKLGQCAEFVIVCRAQSDVDLGDVFTPTKVVQAALSMGKTLRFIKD